VIQVFGRLPTIRLLRKDFSFSRHVLPAVFSLNSSNFQLWQYSERFHQDQRLGKHSHELRHELITLRSKPRKGMADKKDRLRPHV